MTHKGGRKRLNNLMVRREDYEKMVKNLRPGVDPPVTAFTKPGSNKK
jgi:hypothetical protein